MAREFQENKNPQLDSPKAAKESLILLIAIAAKNDFELG